MLFGEKLKQVRERRELSQEDFATILKTSKQVISRYETGTRIPKISTVQEYAKALNVSLLSLVDDKLEFVPDENINSDTYRKVLAQIPFFDTPVSAGLGAYLSDGHEYTWQEFDNIPKDTDFALEVRGDSMTPLYDDGDVVFVKQNIIVESGQIGVFVLNGEGYLKMLQGNKLISLNSQYEPIIIKDIDSFFCVGRVVGKTNK